MSSAPVSLTPAPASAMFCSVVVRGVGSGRGGLDFFESLGRSAAPLEEGDGVAAPLARVLSFWEGMLKDAAVGFRGAIATPVGLDEFGSDMAEKTFDPAGKDNRMMAVQKDRPPLNSKTVSFQAAVGCSGVTESRLKKCQFLQQFDRRKRVGPFRNVAYCQASYVSRLSMSRDKAVGASLI